MACAKGTERCHATIFSIPAIPGIGREGLSIQKELG